MLQLEYMEVKQYGYYKLKKQMAKLEHEEQLNSIFANVNEWLKFAEAKNFGLLTLNAAIVFGLTQIEFCENSLYQKIIFIVFGIFAFFSFLFSLISVFPNVSKIGKNEFSKAFINKFSNWIDKEEVFENIHFYGFLRTIDKSELEIKFLSKVNSNVSFTVFEKEIVEQILFNSRISWLKYQLFKIAAFIFLMGIIATIVILSIASIYLIFN